MVIDMTSDTSANPGTRRRAATRERLLEAAREVLAGDGIQGASVEHICERAGFTRGAFYSNFASKDELVLAIFEREKAAMFETLHAAVDVSGLEDRDLRAATTLIMDRFLELQPGDRDWYLVNAEFGIHGIRHKQVGREFNAIWSRTKSEFADFMVHVLNGMGRQFTIDPGQAATILIGTYDLALREALIDGRPIDSDLLRSSLPDLLLSVTEDIPAAGD